MLIMTYITRNANGEIVAINETPQTDEQEYLPLDDPELVAFIKNSSNDDDIKTILSSSDTTVIRVLEDLINTLIDKKVILFSDLPLPAQEKLATREKIRGHLASLDNLMEEDEGIL